MSSHHVVREAQEPALLILDPQHLSASALAPLLEWSPTIVATAQTFAALTEQGLKVDVVLARQDELPALAALLELQAPVQTVIIPPGKDALDTALAYLVAKNHQAVNILSSHEQLKQDLTEQLARQEHTLNIVILDGHYRHVLCRTGRFSKWLPAGEKVHIRPVAAAGTVSTSGFGHNLQQAAFGENLSLQTAEAGRVRIEASCPCWITESIS